MDTLCRMRLAAYSTVVLIFLTASTMPITRAQAQAAATPYNNENIMVGSASAPVNTSRGGTVRYVITQQDSDTWGYLMNGEWRSLHKRTDTNCNVFGGPDQFGQRRVNSMVSNQFSANLRGITGDTGAAATSYTYTWDITGQAVSTSGNYLDKWILYNDRTTNDVQYDIWIEVRQQVTLNP